MENVFRNNVTIDIISNGNNNDETTDILPVNLTKLIAKFDIIRDKISEQKNSLDDINKDMKTFEKLIKKFVSKYIKKETKPKKPRKKSGFALPVTISDDLCKFMGLEKGSKVSRTEVTQFLTKYIKNNNLEHPERKNTLIKDEKITELLGIDVKDIELNYFSIQKYMNKHFLK